MQSFTKFIFRKSPVVEKIPRKTKKTTEPVNNKARHEELKERAKMLLEKAKQDAVVETGNNRKSKEQSTISQVTF